MAQEKPMPSGDRLYKRHRIIKKRLARKWKVSEAAVIRRLLEEAVKNENS